MITTHEPHEKISPWALFLIFLRLGLTSFGGPVAHLGYFRQEFVLQRRWLSEHSYADLVSLCQFLPGPASSQVGIALGFSRSGYLGALAAWAGFTLPSALALILFSVGLSLEGQSISTGALQGLKIVAVAVVAQAVWGMARNLCTEVKRISVMALTTCVALLVPSAGVQIAVILAAGLAGVILFKSPSLRAHDPLPIAISRRTGGLWLGLFFILLVLLPVSAAFFSNQTLSIIDAFYRAGSLVFGGGHVVLPLLQSEVVPTGWVSEQAFLAGYGLTQAMPGPLFTFAAFLGAAISPADAGWGSQWIGGLIALVAIFVPSFLLVVGALPFWEQLRLNTRMQAALAGINASVVGLLLAALYQPIWINSILSSTDFVLALIAFVALMFWKLPPWLVVIAGAAAGWFTTLI